jgi:hypothetical protein
MGMAPATATATVPAALARLRSMTNEHRCARDLRPAPAVAPLPPLVHVPA